MRKLTYILIGLYIALSSYLLIDLQYRTMKRDAYQVIVNDVVRAKIKQADRTIRDMRLLTYAVMSDFGVRLSMLEHAAKPEGPDEIIIKRKRKD